jgi:Arc/MetJ-type ribon-helix-helix transcriptional regulator
MESQITVRLPEELAERLDRMASERGVRRSQLVREALLAFLEGPAACDAERPFDRVRDLAGVVYGGPPDLGARHREYLKEQFGGG